MMKLTMRSVSTVPVKSILTKIATNRLSYLESKLRLPPKKPNNAFALFMRDSFEGTKTTLVEISSKWKSISDVEKEQLRKRVAEEWKSYSEKVKIYKESISIEEVAAFKLRRIYLGRYKVADSKKFNSLAPFMKPKSLGVSYCLSPRTLFIKHVFNRSNEERSKLLGTDLSQQPTTASLKVIHDTWMKLSEEEKKTFEESFGLTEMIQKKAAFKQKLDDAKLKLESELSAITEQIRAEEKQAKEAHQKKLKASREKITANQRAKRAADLKEYQERKALERNESLIILKK